MWHVGDLFSKKIENSNVRSNEGNYVAILISPRQLQLSPGVLPIPIHLIDCWFCNARSPNLCCKFPIPSSNQRWQSQISQKNDLWENDRKWWKMMENDGKWSYSNYLQGWILQPSLRLMAPQRTLPGSTHDLLAGWGCWRSRSPTAWVPPSIFSEFSWNIQLLGKNFNLWISPAIGVLPFGNPPFASIWLFFTFDF